MWKKAWGERVYGFAINWLLICYELAMDLKEF